MFTVNSLKKRFTSVIMRTIKQKKYAFPFFCFGRRCIGSYLLV